MVELRNKEDEQEHYKSSSDNQDAGSGEDPDELQVKGNKRRHHRHTQHQIQEMERLFKKCPHPDEKARLELSRELNLDPRQVKFWFQNKRTQMKAQLERRNNSCLRNDNDKLRSENEALREAVRSIVCHKCGGPANFADNSLADQQLRVENAKLKEEVIRLSAALAEKNKPSIKSEASPIVAAPSPTSSTELGLKLPTTAAPNDLTPVGPSVADIASRPLGLTDAEKHMVVELAVSAMEELAQVAQAGEPLWVPDPHSGGADVLDHEEYFQQFPLVTGPTPPGLKVEATRDTDVVRMNASLLVETLMDAERWADMFACIILKALTVEVLAEGAAGSHNGTMQVMYAELQMASPVVPTREVYFLRYSKRVDGLWLVADVAVDSLRGNPPPSLLRCRKRPSGCVIEDTPGGGFSKVTWVEHLEVDHKGVHPSFLSLVESGIGFGAQRWLATLQRQCERFVSMLTNTLPTKDSGLPNAEGRRSMLRLAERMTRSFCKGVSGSAQNTWITLNNNGSDDSADNIYMAEDDQLECGRVVIRKSVGDASDDVGRPPGVVLCAATSLRLPLPPSRVFDFLSDERYRTEWDILSNMGVVEQMVHVSKGQQLGNTVSLLRVNAVNSNQSNMLILQECCTDKSSCKVVYAPVDVAAMTRVLNGGDPDAVLLLPSGFCILPDGGPLPHQLPCKQGSRRGVGHVSGSLVTVAFQILVDHLPTAKLSLESIATLNTLILSTVARIKAALSSCEPS